MRLQQLRGLPVIDPVTARKVGVVTDYRLDAVGGSLAAIEAGDSGVGPHALIPAASIRRVGRHAVMLTGRQSPEVEDDESWLTSRALVGLSVMSEDGTALGRLADAELDPDSLAVHDFQLQAPLTDRLFGRQTRPMPLEVRSCSRELLVVAPRAAAQPVVETAAEAAPAAEQEAAAPATSPIVVLKHEDQAAPSDAAPPPTVVGIPPAESEAPQAARANGHNH